MGFKSFKSIIRIEKGKKKKFQSAFMEIQNLISISMNLNSFKF
jgi:hypothetical protein